MKDELVVIDFNDLVKRFNCDCGGSCDFCIHHLPEHSEGKTRCAILNSLRPLEAVRGRWVWVENLPVTDGDDPECIGYTGYECSVCGYHEGTALRFYEEPSAMVLAYVKEGLKDSLTNYCPDCGVKMDAKE